MGPCVGGHLATELENVHSTSWQPPEELTAASKQIWREGKGPGFTRAAQTAPALLEKSKTRRIALSAALGSAVLFVIKKENFRPEKSLSLLLELSSRIFVF